MVAIITFKFNHRPPRSAKLYEIVLETYFESLFNISDLGSKTCKNFVILKSQKIQNFLFRLVLGALFDLFGPVSVQNDALAR